MLDYFQLFNYSRIVTVGECMGDPKENWYRTAGGAPDRTLLVRYFRGRSMALSTNNMQAKKSKSQGSTLRYSAFLLISAQVIAQVFYS
jgi:hypothetical protein